MAGLRLPAKGSWATINRDIIAKQQAAHGRGCPQKGNQSMVNFGVRPGGMGGIRIWRAGLDVWGFSEADSSLVRGAIGLASTEIRADFGYHFSIRLMMSGWICGSAEMHSKTPSGSMAAIKGSSSDTCRSTTTDLPAA